MQDVRERSRRQRPCCAWTHFIAAGEFICACAKMPKDIISSQKGPKVSGHCPSVDVLFDSVADTAGENAIGVILTAWVRRCKRYHQMRHTGAYTIGQDQATSVVYGMPMEAFKLGGICKQLPLDQIQDEVLRRLGTM